MKLNKNDILEHKEKSIKIRIIKTVEKGVKATVEDGNNIIFISEKSLQNYKKCGANGDL